MDIQSETGSPVQLTIYGIRRTSGRGHVPDPFGLIDLSPDGIIAMSDQPYSEGLELLLCLPMSLAHGKRCIPAKVINCDQKDNGFMIGMEFSTEIGQA